MNRFLIYTSLALLTTVLAACGGGGGDSCSSGQCLCSNGVADSGETDVDCGGACAACGDGKKCVYDADCASGSCSAGLCASHCSDGVQNDDETDVDCGGSTCGACGDGKKCVSDADCANGVCSASTNICVKNAPP